MLCYGTRIICHTSKGNYEFIIIKSLPLSTSTHKSKYNSKCVRFSTIPTIHLVPSKYDEDRSLGSEIPRGLKTKWQTSQETITLLLNNTLDNRICSQTPKQEQDMDAPLKIVSSSKGWWEDCSPQEFLNDLSSGKLCLTSLATKIDNIITSTLQFNHRSSVQLKYEEYFIDIREVQRTSL